MPVQPTDGRRRVSRWTWPAVAFLALVVGLLGGFLGALGFDRLGDDNGRFEGGLDAVQTRDSAPLDADNGSVPAVAQALLPSTVQIIAAFDGEDGGATGSGFVLDRQGHIVTNNHVVASAAEDDGTIRVVDSEGTRHDATVVGRSPVYDLAILQVDEVEGLVPAALGASAVLNVGDPVVAFGSPLGLSQTVTSGIVSALNRPVTTGDSDNESSYINAVQTDAAINPGNSGGPLVNLAGEVVGVNSAIATTGGSLMGESSGNIGVGFAIPIEQVRTTADQILATGEARYPVIGAQVRTGGGDSEGALITRGQRRHPRAGRRSAGGRRGHPGRRRPGHRRHRPDRGDPHPPAGRHHRVHRPPRRRGAHRRGHPRRRGRLISRRRRDRRRSPRTGGRRRTSWSRRTSAR